MKTTLCGLAFAILALGFSVVGCGGDTPPPGGPDLASTDLNMIISMPMDGGGTKMFGDLCTVPGNPGDCAPGLICDMFVMNTLNRCTRKCDVNPNPTNCPAPSSGACNGKGECKFTQ